MWARARPVRYVITNNVTTLTHVRLRPPHTHMQMYDSRLLIYSPPTLYLVRAGTGLTADLIVTRDRSPSPSRPAFARGHLFSNKTVRTWWVWRVLTGAAGRPLRRRLRRRPPGGARRARRQRVGHGHERGHGRGARSPRAARRRRPARAAQRRARRPVGERRRRRVSCNQYLATLRCDLH